MQTRVVQIQCSCGKLHNVKTGQRSACSCGAVLYWQDTAEGIVPLADVPQDAGDTPPVALDWWWE
jgi:hypothetical protein